MKKTMKGLLAATAGAALLLGTGATFVLWYDTADFANADTISTGTLELDAEFPVDWVWTNVSNEASADLIGTPFQLGSDAVLDGDDVVMPAVPAPLLVPGDAITGTFDVNDAVTEAGDALAWRLARPWPVLPPCRGGRHGRTKRIVLFGEASSVPGRAPRSSGSSAWRSAPPRPTSTSTPTSPRLRAATAWS